MVIFIPVTFTNCAIVIVPEIVIGGVSGEVRVLVVSTILALYTETVH